MKTQTIINTYIPKTYHPRQEGKLLIYEVPVTDIVAVCTALYEEKGVYLRTITAADERPDRDTFTIYYIFSIPAEDCFLVPCIHLKNTTEFPSLMDTMYEATFYEREIYTFFGLTPTGHKGLQPVILHANWPRDQFPLRKDFKWNHRPTFAPPGTGQKHVFQVIQGEGIYEIPVGPVHAGIIEPGHFRFSVAGEEIVNLEPMLGYVHKGTEKLFETLPLDKKIKLSEHISGDSSLSHSLAFCQAVESIALDIQVPARARFLRVIFAELERLANHLGDIGFIMNDTGFSFGGSQATRLREIIMQLNETLTGHRFLRGVNTIGGVTIDLTPDMINHLTTILTSLEKDFSEIIDICNGTESVLNRLKGTGKLKKEIAWDHGMVGVAARASGLNIDIRIDHPYAAYPELRFKKAVHTDCDVFARYQVRVQEVYSSLGLIKQAAAKMPMGPVTDSQHKKDTEVKLEKNAHALSMVEGWRGDIVSFIITDRHGKITRVAVRDPSFLNWPAVPYAVLENIVPDFPLINKSFNLSYSGYDR